MLKSLVLVYVSPETADNQELRQCLAYFFPVYCYSNPRNQRRMQQVMRITSVHLWRLLTGCPQIFVPLFEQLAGALREWSEDTEHDPITSSQLGLMFVDWTDPLKAVYVVPLACKCAVTEV